MVRGIDEFKRHFAGFENNYTIIGGAACSFWVQYEGLTPRSTNDIDLLLIIETYNIQFNQQLWNFFRKANYKSLSSDKQNQRYFRFSDPAEKRFPQQIEILCRPLAQ